MKAKTICLKNVTTNKNLVLPERMARDFFRLKKGITSLMCLPVSEQVKIPPNAVRVQVLQNADSKRKKKLSGICVIRMGGLGDLIMLSSGLRRLKELNPRIPLIFATIPRHIKYIKSLPFVDRVISTLDIGKYSFDKMFDLRFAVEPPQLGTTCKGTWNDYTTKDRSDIFDELLGVYPAPKRFAIFVNEKSVLKMKELVFDLRPVLTINSSIVAPARSIIPQYIESICKKVIKETDFLIALTGVSQPWNKNLANIKDQPRLVNLIDKTTIEELIALCSISDLIVTPDTGTLHIAGAMGKRTIGLFGGINPRTRVSYYPHVKSLYPHGELPCVPCFDIHKCMNGKPEDGSKCMRLHTPQKIADAIIEQMRFIQWT